MLENKQHALIGAAALLIGVMVMLSATGIGAALLQSDEVTLDDPGTETVQVDVDLSADTTATVALERDGTAVKSETLDGTSGDSLTADINGTGMADGSYSLNVSSPDEANVSVVETRMITEPEKVMVTSEDNGTVAVDVAFDAEETTNATVVITDESGATTHSETLVFDPVDYEGGSGLLTTSYVSESYDGNLTATVTTTEAAGYDGAWLSADGSSGGFLTGLTGGDSNTMLLAGAVLVIGWGIRKGAL